MDAMASPEEVRVKVDRQGRLVLPQRVRDGLVTLPGEVLLRRTPEGLLLRPISRPGTVRTADDGLPVLRLDRPVTNAEVLAAVDRERDSR